MNGNLNQFILAIFLCITVSVNAQYSKYSLQIDHGISKTSHHRIEARFLRYYGGVQPLVKQEKLSFHMNLSLNRRLNKFNKIIIGLGFAEYRFIEKGLYYSDAFGTPPVPYAKNHSFQYFNLSLGHQLRLDRGQFIIPYIENSIYVDKTFKSDLQGLLFYLGISLKSEIGIAYYISNIINLSLGVFYKSAIYSYGGFYGSEYQFMPYAYGLELGVASKL